MNTNLAYNMPISLNQPKVYAYARLSRDEDSEMISLNNQKQILLDYAKKVGYNLLGIFEDDNVSGMHFDRDGINRIRDLAESGGIDILLVKDLSRVGRHKALSALFLEDMRLLGVKVYSVTENLDNMNENDGLVIGFKQIINDEYARDISRKIKHGFKQKQKEGIVIVPPYGLIKDKVTKEVTINEECAEVVRRIFRMYADGLGTKKIAQALTNEGVYSPAYMQTVISGGKFRGNKKWVGNTVWSDRTILRIVENDAYIGVLRCGTTKKPMIGAKQQRNVPESEQSIHYDFYPPIIDKMLWDEVQAIKKNRSLNNVRASSQSKVHRYAGLLRCGDCGATFVAKKRQVKTDMYVEYVCNGYHRYGKNICTPHRLKESYIDEILYQSLSELKKVANENILKVDRFIRDWNSKKRDYDKSIEGIQIKIFELKDEIKAYAKQNAKGQLRDDIYNELTNETYQSIEVLEKQIDTLKEIKEINKEAKAGLLKSIDLLDSIIADKSMTDSQLQLLVDKIEIKENSEGKLEIQFLLNTPFKQHLSLSETFTEATLS